MVDPRWRRRACVAVAATSVAGMLCADEARAQHGPGAVGISATGGVRWEVHFIRDSFPGDSVGLRAAVVWLRAAGSVNLNDGATSSSLSRSSRSRPDRSATLQATVDGAHRATTEYDVATRRLSVSGTILRILESDSTLVVLVDQVDGVDGPRVVAQFNATTRRVARTELEARFRSIGQEWLTDLRADPRLEALRTVR